MSYDHYKETEKLIGMLEKTSLKKYGEVLGEAMGGGSTGTEIFMSLRCSINKLLIESSIDDSCKSKAKKLLSELDKSLQG